MDKKNLKLFTIIGISSTFFGLLSVVFTITGVNTKFSALFEVIGEIGFLTMLFFIADDLKQNYKKEVWLIYLFACYSLFTSLIFMTGTTQNTSMFMWMILGILSLAFAIFLMQTAYRLFGIVFLCSLLIIGVLPYIASVYFTTEQLIFVNYFYSLAKLYPLILIYIARSRYKKMEAELESIGLEVK